MAESNADKLIRLTLELEAAEVRKNKAEDKLELAEDTAKRLRSN